MAREAAGVVDISGGTVSTTSSTVLGASLVAAVLALSLTWPRPNSAPPPPAVGRYQLCHVPLYVQPSEVPKGSDLVGKPRGTKVYVLDTQTGRLLSEAEAKEITSR